MDDILNNSNEKYVSVFKAGEINLGILKGSIETVNKMKMHKHIRLQ